MRPIALAAATWLVLALAGCDGDEADGGGDGGSGAELVVFAASSLQPAFEAYAEDFSSAEIAFSFAGSDALAAQIRQGVAPDVFAAANAAYPEQLAADGLLGKPVVFATNELVLAVPADSPIGTVAEVAESGVVVAIGQQGVPVGDYAREVLAGLPGGQGEAILANVGSDEPDVAGIVGKLTQGAVDAGFVYRSDVAAAGGDLEAIDLPGDVSPAVAYGVAVGSDSAEPEAAQRFVDGLLEGAGAEALADSDFGPPPDGAAGG